MIPLYFYTKYLSEKVVRLKPDQPDHVTPSENAAASKKRTKGIIGARELTANDYTARHREEERTKNKVPVEKNGKEKSESVWGKRKRKPTDVAKRAEKEATKTVEKEEAKKC